MATTAQILFSRSVGISDDNGLFEVELKGSSGNGDLIAYARDVQPAILPDFAKQLAKNPSLAHNIVLNLGPSTLSISGRVVDASGSPIRNAVVVLDDGIADGNSYQWIENSISGQRGQGEKTDRAGRFTLKGLSDRNYNVRAIDKAGVVVLESGPVPAGTKDLVLRTPKQPHRRIEGVLVDANGAPIVGARLGIKAYLFRVANRAQYETIGVPIESGSDGYFVIEKCPIEHIDIWIGGTGIKTMDLEIPAGDAPARVVVQRLFKFVPRITGDGTADHFAVLDAEGNRMTSARHSPGMTSHNYVHDIVADNSPFYEVDDRATQLLLLKGKTLVRRVPLHFRPLELNVVDI
ncbi:MAG: hypothetical protein ACI8UD_001665 [Planctomycetota bacterium]|jgi:hypothetical protein